MMIKGDWKHGLEHAWESLSDGWRELRERTAGALTRFKPRAPSADDDDDELPFSSQWGLLAADMFDADDKLVVRLEAPGMRREDLDIEVQGDLLVIEGRKRLERERRGGRYRLMQCSYGSFRRALQLPASVHADKASASYRDGVLRIELPKREPLHTHRIAVKAA